MDSFAPPPSSQTPPVAPPAAPSAPATKTLTSARIFSILLIVAAVSSILSTLAFVGYLVLPALAGAHQRTNYTALYAIGAIGLVVAEVCQILGVLVLIRQWLSHTNAQKKPKELLVLLLSLIPYMVVIIFLVTLIVYLRARRQDPASARTVESAHDLKQQVADTIIDVGANSANSAAGSPASPAPVPASPQLAAKPTMQEAIRRVVGPSTGRSVGNTAHALVAVTMVSLALSTVATAGIVVPAKGLAPLQSSGGASPAPVSRALIAQCFGDPSQVGTVTQAGDILFTQVALGFLAYPSVMLPDSTSLAHPYQLKSGVSEIPSSTITNPGLADDAGGGFTVGICDASATKTHTVQALTAKITSFTAYTGQLNAVNECDLMLTSHHDLTGGGCGGAVPGCMCFHAPFPPTATVGAEVTMKQTGASLNQPGDNLGALPLTLAPHTAFSAYVGMDTPSAAGRYTFSFGVRLDGQKTILSSGASPIILLAPVAHHWDGQACQNNPAMLSQITPTTPETYYICPGP